MKENRMMTDHQEIIDALRKWDNIEYAVAADLLELHDRTGLNLHQAPNMLAFVEKYASYTMAKPIEIQDNGA
jgi:hypothetical protein